MAQYRSPTRKRARVELHWTANRVSNFKRAVVEDVSDIDGDDVGNECTGATAAAHEEEELGSGLAFDSDADSLRKPRSTTRFTFTGAYNAHKASNSGRESYREGTTIDQEVDRSSRRLRNKQRSMSTDALSMDGGKQKTAEELVHHEKASRSLEPLDPKKVPGVLTAKQGHSYQDVLVSDHAQMHAGNVYSLFHATFQGPGFAADGPLRRQPIHEYKAVKVCLGTWAVLLAFLGTLEQLFLFAQFSIQQSMVEPSLPKQIALDTATFEDALGVKVIIDLKFIGDWDRFQYLLHRSFVNREGSQRVANSGYRLFRQATSDQLFHPKFLPSFSSVFSHGQDVRMSLHFGWNEVADKQCPRCGLQSDHDTTAEILCARCNFLYRSQVRDVGNAATSSDFDGLPQNNAEGKPSHGPSRDIPGHFHRISISARDDLRLDTRPSAAALVIEEPMLQLHDLESSTNSIPSAVAVVTEGPMLQLRDFKSPSSTPPRSPRTREKVAHWLESIDLPLTSSNSRGRTFGGSKDVDRGNASKHHPRSTS